MVNSIGELREALQTAVPGDTILLGPGEYAGPLLIDVPVTLQGQDRRTVLWRRGGPVVYVRSPNVTLRNILIERTVERQGPLVVHSADCAPIGKESMQVDSLINLGDLIPGSTLLLPLELQTTAPTEIAVTGLYGAQVAPATLDSPGKHLVWLTLDGKTLQRGEILLGEMTLREGSSVRYYWLSGNVLETVQSDGNYCLAVKKTRLYPSTSGLMLDSMQLSALDIGDVIPGRYAFIGRDATGTLFVHVPGRPPSPVMVNGMALEPWSRILLREKDTVKISGIALTVQPMEALPFGLEPPLLQYTDFVDQFPDALALTLDTGKTAWKGRAVSTVPWIDVTPAGDLRVPATRSHSWTVQLNGEALALPNGPHDAHGGVMIISSVAVIGVDVRFTVRRPDVLLQAAQFDLGQVEFGWLSERTLAVPVGNLGRLPWTGTVRANVPWLEVVTPMPLTCGPWSEVPVEVRLVPNWDQLIVGVHEIPGALMIGGPVGDIPVGTRIEVTAPRGHITALSDLIEFNEVERNAPLPEVILQVRNDGGSLWTGTVRAIGNWLRTNPDQLALEPGAVADIEIGLLDVPAELALDTPVVIDEIHLEGADSSAVVSVQLTVVELPPYLVASPVNFPPFIKGDNPPETQLRIYNNGPARWKGSVESSLPWLTVPAGLFVCEPGDIVTLTIALNSKAAEALSIGFSHRENAIEVSGGRQRTTTSVSIDLRDPISEIHLDTPTLNFGQFDGASTSELPSQPVRLVNASPAAWTGTVALAPHWLSVRGTARTFTLEIPGMSVAEFAVVLNDAARYLPPGVTVEERALTITGTKPNEQPLVISALVSLNEWAPVITIMPQKLALSADGGQNIRVRNAGKQPWVLQVQAAPWLVARPAEFSVAPAQEQVIEVLRASGPFGDITGDPRGIVLVGAGSEVEVDVELLPNGG